MSLPGGGGLTCLPSKQRVQLNLWEGEMKCKCIKYVYSVFLVFIGPAKNFCLNIMDPICIDWKLMVCVGTLHKP